MKRLFSTLAVLLVAACQPLPSPVAENRQATPVPTTSTDCAAKGGTMQPVGRAQTMQCVIAYADAGKRCTTGSDCLGDCRVEDAPFPADGSAAVGRCQADSQPFGCYARVENGRTTSAICID